MREFFIATKDDLVHAFENVSNKRLGFILSHGLNKHVALSKYLDELLIGQEEESRELASFLLEEIHETSSNCVTLTIIGGKLSMESLSSVHLVDILLLLETFG